MSESNTEINYKEAYEREHEKCADLADKIVVLESEKEDLQFKLDRIKKNKFWKATGLGIAFNLNLPLLTALPISEGTAVTLRWSQRYPAEDP